MHARSARRRLEEVKASHLAYLSSTGQALGGELKVRANDVAEQQGTEDVGRRRHLSEPAHKAQSELRCWGQVPVGSHYCLFS